MNHFSSGKIHQETISYFQECSYHIYTHADTWRLSSPQSDLWPLSSPTGAVMVKGSEAPEWCWWGRWQLFIDESQADSILPVQGVSQQSSSFASRSLYQIYKKTMTKHSLNDDSFTQPYGILRRRGLQEWLNLTIHTGHWENKSKRFCVKEAVSHFLPCLFMFSKQKD